MEPQSRHSLLAEALGRLLSTSAGERVAILPLGLSAEEAAAVVRSANRQRPLVAPCYAVLMSASTTQLPGIATVDAREAARYREGDRLFVCDGSIQGLTSNNNTSVEVLNSSWPENSLDGVSLRRVAEQLLSILLGEKAASDAAVEVLVATLDLLTDCYVRTGGGVSSWNALWWEHVSLGLDALKEVIAHAEPSVDRDQFLKDHVPACFGLPRIFESGKPTSLAAQLVQAWSAHWWSAESAASASKGIQLRYKQADRSVPPIVNVDFAALDLARAATGHAIRSWAASLVSDSAAVRALAQLSVDDFCKPYGNDDQEITVTAQGVQCALDILTGRIAFVTSEESEARTRSEFLELRLPVVLQATDLAGPTQLMVTTSLKAFQFEGSVELVAGRPVVRGRLFASGRRYQPKTVRLGVSIPAGDPLEGVVPATATCQIVMMHPLWPTVAIRPIRKGKLGARLDLTVLAPDTPSRSATLEVADEHRVVVATPSGAVPLLQGKGMDVWPERLQFRQEKIPAGDATVEVESCTLDLRLPNNPGQTRIAPILANIEAVAIADGPAPDETVGGIRGALEQELCELVMAEEEPWRHGLGHYVLPAGEDDCSPGFQSDPLGVFRGSPDWVSGSRWKDLKLPVVPDVLLLSAEAEEFRDSFRGLGIAGDMRSQLESGRFWPSRLDYGALWETPELARYLSAYAALTGAARSLNDDVGIFWAAYPFSCSAWSVDNIAQLSAVLLSPLHPIRLAWAAGVSRAILEEEDPERRKRFAGVIEGWNLPYLGPAEVAEGQVIAIPIDNGPQQLFLGWSMLVRTSNMLAPLRAPRRIGGLRAPGSSVSGLNGSSASKAIRDYRRLHPFASTLTVDLASGSPGPRIEAVDRAVLDEIASWAGEDGDSLLGGARVWDSMNRTGEPPGDEVANKLSPGTPLTWSRYKPGPSGGPRSNLRVLQDAGHTVQVKATTSEPMGSLGAIPLRRFEVLSNISPNDNEVDSAPGVRTVSGWEPFLDALRSAEGVVDGTDQPLVRSVLAGAALSADAADWTITGDALMNPSALARQVSSSSSSHLALWEWRPPFLTGGHNVGEALLERRPYVSVVRLPGTLKTRVEDLISKSWSQSWGVRCADVLAELGSRGIGLSSLLAIGGAQARGALGFYTTLKMLDRAKPLAGEQLVLPIDACDQYLTALSSASPSLVPRRRADLLVIRVLEDGLVLLPIEIKYYGSDSPSGTLPQVDSAALDDPLEQLDSTSTLLRGLEDGGGGHLWNTALAALVEVGFRLNPSSLSDRGWCADQLARIANGELPLRVGRPLLTFFRHGSSQYRITKDVTSGKFRMGAHGELVADPALAAEALFAAEEHSALLTEWSDLVDWGCLGSGGDLHSGEQSLNSAQVSNEGPAAGSPEGERSADFVREGAGEPREVGGRPDVGERGKRDLAMEAAETGDRALRGDGVRFAIGQLLDSVGQADADFWPANTELSQLNVGVVGNLGTGKTQLIKALVAKLREASSRAQPEPVSVLILDYKGDFSEEDFLSEVGGRLLRPHRIPLNYFELQEPYSAMAAVRKAGSFNDVLNQIFNIGPKQQNTLRRVILELFNAGRAPTIDEVLSRYMEESDYDSVVGVLEGWVLGEVFGTRGQTLESFSDMMNDSVVVLNLLDFGSDQNSKNALVAMFLNLYYEYMAKLPKWPFEGDQPQLRRLNSYLLVDEATNIMSYNFDALGSLLLQGRQFGLGVILSSQYLSHFKSTKIDYAQALRSWVIHAVPNVTASQLQSLGIPNATDVTAKRIVGLPNHHALYSSLNYPGRFIHGEPFYRWVERTRGSSREE